jgi:hypothetical protein
VRIQLEQDGLSVRPFRAGGGVARRRRSWASCVHRALMRVSCSAINPHNASAA